MKFSEETKNELMEKLGELARKAGSMSAAGKLTGLSPGIISGLVHGNYKGNADAQYEVLYNYFKAAEQQEEAGSRTDDRAVYVPTSISEEICAVIRNCQINGGLAVVSGHAGIGKTMAIRRFERENRSLAVVITVSACTKSIKSVLKQLCEKFSIKKGASDDMWFAIANKLHDKMVLIFDEAQHLPLKTIEMLRSFSDYFYARGQTLGIVFVGNLEVAENFKGSRCADYAQIVNRTRLNRRYYTTDVTEEDVKKLFPRFSDDEMKLDFMLSICRSLLGIRRARAFYEDAIDSNVKTYDELVEFAKKLDLEF